jgi:hypothetical protein
MNPIPRAIQSCRRKFETTAESVSGCAGRPAQGLKPAKRAKSTEIRPRLVGAPASIGYAAAIPFCLREST